MAHPWYHAVLAARRFGGTPEDYLEIETWMDFTKSHTPDCRHRLLLHNAWGVFLAERILGATLIRASDDKVIPLRPLLEDHITQDFGRIPTLAVCFAQLAPEPLDPDMTVYDQCLATAEEVGGVWTDYQALHQFLDWPRDCLPDGRFRRVLHNSWGVGLAEQAFGLAFTRASDGVEFAIRPIVERHIVRELGTIPTLDAALEGVTLQRWMCSRAMPASMTAVAQDEEPA
jgi:hypothetical protein